MAPTPPPTHKHIHAPGTSPLPTDFPFSSFSFRFVFAMLRNGWRAATAHETDWQDTRLSNLIFYSNFECEIFTQRTHTRSRERIRRNFSRLFGFCVGERDFEISAREWESGSSSKNAENFISCFFFASLRATFSFRRRAEVKSGNSATHTHTHTHAYRRQKSKPMIFSPKKLEASNSANVNWTFRDKKARKKQASKWVFRLVCRFPPFFCASRLR